jgi:acyl-coenzyme A thioesterase PaaI-like protein
MTGSLIIAPRFCGPPDSGNGGYVCGLVAGHVDGPAEVTLRLPPPLGKPLAVERDEQGQVRVLDGNTLIAEATRLPKGARFGRPWPVSVPQARAASARSPLRLHPELHPLPTCFVCGPRRAPGDGLRICVGPVPGTQLSAGVWRPDEEFAAANGNVRPEFLWAALDCPGGIAALLGAAPDRAMYLLGRLAVRRLGPAKAGEPHVVVGWCLAARERKVLAGSALLTASGRTVAVARATWIRLRAQATPPAAAQQQAVEP